MIWTLTALDLLFAILGGVFALFVLYLVVVAAAALLYRPGREGSATRLTVVIPAHDEEASIARCVESLRAQTYPSELVDVVVVADNCTDDTAAVAGGGSRRPRPRGHDGAREGPCA
jgi:1,2-diacylglycerol 3-beta-glucosyltransferase